MRSESVIETTNLTRRFGDVTAVDSLTLTVQRGEVFGFLGHNGAGKTTTVRLLNGVLRPSAGGARVLGLSPVAEGPDLRRRTGVLTETPSLDERLTGRDNLSIYADLYGVPVDEVAARVTQLLDWFQLGDRAAERVGGYSKGMKQRLALARALVHRPEILFLDEPTAGLDPVAARQVHGLVRDMSAEGHTIFLCTHNLVEAQQLCDRVGVMERGRLIALGTPVELARRLSRTQRLLLEVTPPTRDAALRTLATMPELTVETEGNGRLTVTGAEREHIPDLLAALVAAGIGIYSAAPQEPSLEDVYFALYQAGEARNEERPRAANARALEGALE